MAAYIIVRMHVTDMEQFKEYTKAAPDVVYSLQLLRQ